MKIVGTYSSDELAGKYVVSRALYANTSGSYFDFSVFINTAPGVSASQAVAAIKPLVEQYGNGELQSRSEYIDAQAAGVNQLLALIYGLLALSIVIAAVGIVITLLLSVYERRREIALAPRRRHDSNAGVVHRQLGERDHQSARRRSRRGARLVHRVPAGDLAEGPGHHGVHDSRSQHDRDPGRRRSSSA